MNLSYVGCAKRLLSNDIIVPIVGEGRTKYSTEKKNI